MDRRKSLKIMALGTLSTGVLLEACTTENKKKSAGPGKAAEKKSKESGRMQEETAHLESIQAVTFFSAHEMRTITLLADIIIPADGISGSASEAGVPDFIEFIVKDKPEFKLPLRGGLQWLDQQCYKRFDSVFADCRREQQIQLIDMIAYPRKAKPEMQQGVTFFNLMRNLTASGFYTSEIGVRDIGYAGNQPNMWNGVPDDVLKQYGLSYTEQQLRECATYAVTNS